MQSSTASIQGNLGKFRDGANRNFKKFNMKCQMLYLGQNNSTVTNVSTHWELTG